MGFAPGRMMMGAAGVSAGGLSYAFTDHTWGVDSASLSYGTSAANRKLVIFCGIDKTSGTTCTVDGNSATSIAQINNGAESVAAFYYELGAGATSGTIAFAGDSGTSARRLISVYAVYGAATGAPTVTGSDTADATASVTLTIPTPGVGVAMAYERTNSAHTYTWTEFTEDFDDVPLLNSVYDGTGASNSYSTGGSKTVTCAPSAGGVRDPILYVLGFGT